VELAAAAGCAAARVLKGSPTNPTVARRAAILFALVLLWLPAGCGSSSSAIRTGAEGSQYLDDVLKGAAASGKLADDASLDAKLAFERAKHVATVRSIREDVADDGSSSDWACTAIGIVADSGDFIAPPPNVAQAEAQIAANPPADASVGDRLLEALRGLAGSDAAKLADAICDSAF
jgi:hypothetical protein